MLRRVALLAMMVSGCTLVGEEPTEFGAPEEPVISPADVTELAIGAGDIQRNVDFLDSVLTRRDRTRPLDRAAAWLAERFRAAGFTPAGDLSGYLQYRSIRGVDPDSLLLPNVVATLPGSDPARSGEYVILLAHLGAPAVVREEGGDQEDARADSGREDAVEGAAAIAALAEVAEALGAITPRPARPILLLAATGEDRGGEGARWFAEHPTVILSSAAAVIHLDVPRRSERLHLNGDPSAPTREAGQVVRRHAGGLEVVQQAGAPAGGHAPSVRPFVALGIPALSMRGQSSAEPDRDPDDLGAATIARIARLVVHVAHTVASPGSGA